MDKQIKKIEKEVGKTKGNLKQLEKMDKKRDKLVKKGRMKKGKC